jgi:alpha-1,3-rhamnosyltransferase
MADPLVTIAIPSYNHARWLPESIESVLGQTYENVELLIVEDCSTDDSLAIAERYAAAHPERIRLLTHAGQRNLGTSAALNLALDHASGDYWSINGSDDILLSHRIERQVEVLEANAHIVFVYGLSELIADDGRPIPNRGPLGRDITQLARPVERLLRGNVIPDLTGLSRMAAMQAPTPIRYQEELLYGDWEFWIRLAARGPFAFLPETLGRSRIHRSNVSWGNELAVDRARNLDVIEGVRDNVDDVGGALAATETRGVLGLELAFRRHECGDLSRAETELAAAFAVDPSLARGPDRYWSWLLEAAGPTAVLGSSGGHLAAERWLRGGAIGSPPAGAEPRNNFAIWSYSLLPATVRVPLVDRLASLQIPQAAFAAEERGQLGVARRQALRCVWNEPRLLRSAAFRRLLVKLVVGSRATARVRSLRR